MDIEEAIKAYYKLKKRYNSKYNSNKSKIIKSDVSIKEKQIRLNNYFIIIGPKQDPARIKNFKNPYKAFKKIFNLQKYFISRGDKSGTHDKELQIWDVLSINPTTYSGKWYLETGSSMGSTINIAIGLGGYTLTDRATWINFGNKKDFSILVAGHDSLHNPYGIIAINNDKCPNTKFEKSLIFIKWLLSKKGQKLIASYKINGEQLFFPALK